MQDQVDKIEVTSLSTIQRSQIKTFQVPNAIKQFSQQPNRKIRLKKKIEPCSPKNQWSDSAPKYEQSYRHYKKRIHKEPQLHQWLGSMPDSIPYRCDPQASESPSARIAHPRTP